MNMSFVKTLNADFLEILLKPLLLKNLGKLIWNFFLVFLPSLLALFTLGGDNWLFGILFFMALIISNGFLWQIFQKELEEKTDNLPEFNMINSLFIGIKGLIFFLFSLFWLFLLFGVLWLIVNYRSDFIDIAKIVGIIGFLYWILLFYPITMGMFADDFNAGEALKLNFITQIIGGSWLNCLIAGLYLFVYAFIIGLIYWAFILLFSAKFSYFLFAVFILYAFIIYFLFYAKVFKEIRAEFESHF